MIDNFHTFAEAVERRFNALSQHELWVTDTGDLFDHYLLSFPLGTNPVFRERTEHDCSCCKNFIRNLGSVVAIIDGKLQSVWQIADLPAPYNEVANALHAHVTACDVLGPFRTKESRYGAPFTRELVDGSETRTWHHFWGNVAQRHRSMTPDESRGRVNEKVQLLGRALSELKMDALDEVLDLIATNSLYRGQEHEASVKAFRALKAAHEESDDPYFTRSNYDTPSARFRNTVIGTLVQDISDGVPLERAVKSFEAKVAPSNYKRPKALITPKMVENAMAELREMGLESAVERRFARIEDVSVNNVLFVDGRVRELMQGGIEAALLAEAKQQAPRLNAMTEITVDTFFSEILPYCKSIDLALENRHFGNFMSLTAPVHADAGQLFRWDNNFAWSYDGDVTDGIKQRVKKAGGNVDALLRCSLGWDYSCDLDIHCVEPGGNHIYYGNKSRKLDVDMNAHEIATDPVENICWNVLGNGIYKVYVHNYNRRATDGRGFEIELEYDGQIHRYHYEKSLRDSERVDVLEFKVEGGRLVEIVPDKSMVADELQQVEKWGVKTRSLVPVDTVMLSPNHWDGQTTGNRHWFFILKGCQNPDPVRGIYNEFLHPNLEKHRKVFEVLGAKTKCPPSASQLSGVGFSSTKKDDVSLVVDGRPFKITF